MTLRNILTTSIIVEKKYKYVETKAGIEPTISGLRAHAMLYQLSHPNKASLLLEAPSEKPCYTLHTLIKMGITTQFFFPIQSRKRQERRISREIWHFVCVCVCNAVCVYFLFSIHSQLCGIHLPLGIILYFVLVDVRAY